MSGKRCATWMEPFLKRKRAVILDGGMGTTLAEQGANVKSAFWSASMFTDDDSPVKPSLVYDIHYQFLQAGADVIIANTYQLSQELIDAVFKDRTLGEGYKISQELFDTRAKSQGLSLPSAAEIISRAVALAVAARDDYQATCGPNEPRRLVCCAFGPYGTSLPFSGAEYVGNYECSYQDLLSHWTRRLEAALDTQTDLLGFETIPDLRETRAICEVLNTVKPDRPCWLSWTCKDEKHIHGGPLLLDCVKIVEDCPYIDTVGVNCTAPQYILPIIQDMYRTSTRALLTYPNSGREWDAREEVRAWTGEKQDFDSLTGRWNAAGAVCIGGCCDCNAHHIHSIVKSLSSDRARL